MKYIIGGLVVIILIAMGAWMATFVISGLVLFGGFVALVETIGPLRYIVVRTTALIDFVIFGLSIYLLFNSGVTVAFATGIAGLLFTIYYKPFLISREVNRRMKEA